MADNDAPNNAKASARDAERDEELDNLKRELANLKAAVAERAQYVYDSAAERASRATAALRSQAGVVRDNPTTFSTAFLAGGIIGLVIGLALGTPQSHSHRRWYDRD